MTIINEHIKIDEKRQQRRGFPEVIYCESKSVDQLLDIFDHFYKEDLPVMGTRCNDTKAKVLTKKYDDLQYNDISGTIMRATIDSQLIGEIAICTAGSSDIKVAVEAADVATFFGAKVNRYYDIGIAGINRLFDNIEDIRKANAIIAIAGMDGALPGVIGGLVDVPVIAVPTSVGYGASFKGVSALLTMLNSCAEGVTVVNIDNGFGAAYSACQINRMVEYGR